MIAALWSLLPASAFGAEPVHIHEGRLPADSAIEAARKTKASDDVDGIADARRSLDALRSAAAWAAAWAAADVGRGAETGSLAPGKAADLVAVDGGPLLEVGRLESVSLVMKAGHAVRRQWVDSFPDGITIA